MPANNESRAAFLKAWRCNFVPLTQDNGLNEFLEFVDGCEPEKVGHALTKLSTQNDHKRYAPSLAQFQAVYYRQRDLVVAVEAPYVPPDCHSCHNKSGWCFCVLLVDGEPRMLKAPCECSAGYANNDAFFDSQELRDLMPHVWQAPTPDDIYGNRKGQMIHGGDTAAQIAPILKACWTVAFSTKGLALNYINATYNESKDPRHDITK